MDSRLFFLILFSISLHAAAEESCAFSVAKKVIVSDLTQIHLRLDLIESPELTKISYPKTEKTVLFQNEIMANVPVKDGDLIRAQIPNYKEMPILQGRLSMVADNKIGEIRLAQCLENYLYSLYLESFYLRDFPSEYQAYVLSKPGRRGGSKKIRVYFSAGDGKVWGHSPPTNDAVLNLLDKEINSYGWQYEYHLHSHPFFYDVLAGYYMGIIAPSDADLNTYSYWFQNLGMKDARITNGINTFILKSSELDVIMSTFPSEDSAPPTSETELRLD